MSVFLTALVLVIVFAGLGHRLGAIRGLISLAGVVVGGALAFPIAPKITPLFTAAASKSPLWNWVLPPLAAFIAVQLVFALIAYLVHRKIAWHYKYKSTDEARHCWERLNSRLGVSVGAVTACAYLLMLGTIFYAAGYLTYQLSSADPNKDDPQLRRLNAIRDDLHATGLDRAIAALDPTPKGFYAAADLAGLLYHNPYLQTKLGDYPALLELAERPEFQDLARDPQFNEFILTQPSIVSIIKHPKVDAIFANAEVLQAIYQLDPEDLLGFIRNGKSALFGEEKILGRWEMASAASFAVAYRKNPQMKTADSNALKRALDALASASFIAMPDKRVIFRGPGLNKSGGWNKSGDGYILSVEGPSISIARAGGAFDQAAVIDGQLHVSASADGFALVFNRPE